MTKKETIQKFLKEKGVIYYVSNPSGKGNDNRFVGEYKGRSLYAKGSGIKIYEQAYAKIKMIDDGLL